ncbi:hypothetical protein GCM10023194_68540 [Planotetraspora phitsanulokensis]|uniref:Uncharacterized protein n=1 Tax=Planotetraspora phitsanulokensis TaxID=575192 RepID=A0A8J3U6I9_9ACTN|nr:hypothetical protein [Planotetraspora phitsanulokensis]GII39583.1 hypothetical protein Pph01_45860 [Planotetraspora phitsanulokensis]
MRLSEKRWTELARESNHYGEQAALLLLDGHYEIAMGAAGRAIRAASRLHRNDKGDRDVIEVLADYLRNRAQIQSLWARTPDVWTPKATALIKGGIKDATQALKLVEELAAAPDAKYPLRPAEVRLTLSELHGMAGDMETARESAESSIADYRRHCTSDDRDQRLPFARALSRYADIMIVAGREADALAARRRSIELSRPDARPDGWLWTTRYDRGLVWLSTQTLERFCHTAFLLAEQLAEQLALGDTSAAGEALLALQDVAEGYAGLIEYSPSPRDALWSTSRALERQADWLLAVDEPELAEDRMTARAALNGRHAHEVVTRLRAPLGEVVERLVTGRGTPQ